MDKITRTLGFGAVLALIVGAILLFGFIFGWIDSEALQTGLGKTLAAIGVVVVTTLGILGVAALLNKD